MVAAVALAGLTALNFAGSSGLHWPLAGTRCR